MDVVDGHAYDQHLRKAQAQLEPATFDEVWAAGRAMSLELAIAAALDGARAAQADLPNRLPTKPEQLYPDLTAREVEVLRLVAQGLTNPQIAEQLVISPRTVHAHLRTIYSKLDVNTRSAATRFALEHHLAVHDPFEGL